MASQPELITSACDGACSGNPGPGGWACLLRFSDGSEEEMGGFEPRTTNNRMELQAALWLLKRCADLPRSPGFAIRTDSRYLIDGYTRWLPGWKRKGWRTAAGKAVLNRDLWESLDAARLAGVALVHVKGHSGDPDNERVDAIAVAFSQGGHPPLNTTTQPTVTKAARSNGAIPPPNATQPTEQPADAQLSASSAPAFLRDLLRLDVPAIVQHLATRGYGFTLEELARLMDQPLSRIRQHQAPWLWRGWLVKPGDDGFWRLQQQVATKPTAPSHAQSTTLKPQSHRSPRHSQPAFTGFTVVELKRICRSHGIRNYAKLKKAELCSLLQDKGIVIPLAK